MKKWLEKLNEKFMYRRSFLYVLAGSYTLLLLLSVVMSLAVYNSTRRVVDREIVSTNEVQRRLLAGRFDAQISDTENLMSRINANKKINAALRKIKNNELLSVTERNEVSQELFQAKINMDFVSDVYLYFKNCDLVITDTSPVRKSVAYDVYHGGSGLSFDEWDSMMNRDYVRSFVPVKMRPYGLYSDTEIAYMQMLPTVGHESGVATLVIIIRTEKFMNAFSDLYSEKNNMLFITNKSGETLFSNCNSVFEKSFAERFKSEEGSFGEKINGVPHLFAYMRSSVNNNIYYVSVIQEAAFWEKARTIRNITFIEILGLLVLGGISVFYFSKKNFSPTQEIVKKISRDFGSSSEQIGNEHKYILNAINKAHEQIISNDNSLRLQNNKLRDYFLRGLLQGRYMDRRFISSNIKHYGIYADDGEYIVFLLNVYECEELFKDYDCSINEQESMTSFILSNVLGDLFEEEYKCMTVLLDESITACIVRCVGNAKGKINEAIGQTYNFVSENFGIYFTASVSGPHKFDDLSEAYFEALSVTDIGENDDAVVFYDEVSRHEADYVYDAKTEQKLLNVIRAGEESKAEEFLSAFLDENKQLLSNKETGASFKYDILSTMLKALSGAEYEKFIAECHPSVCLENASNTTAVKAALLSLVKSACRYAGSSDKNDKAGSLCRRIIEFIDKNYSDCNLSIVMLGDHFEMTPHYLSKQFKDETGENLKTYINMYRVQKSKELLGGTNMNLNEIAHEVGFIDSNAFIRVFKQYEGITPGKHREIHVQ